MTDEPVWLDASPSIGPLGTAGRVHEALVDAMVGPALRFPAPPRPDGPGYLVLSRGDLVPGAPVAIGAMPRGIGGGVAEWTLGRVAEAPDLAAAVEGEAGWFVPEGAVHCPRCGDQNWETPRRRCITCTDGDDSYAGGVFAAGWSVEAGARARRMAGRG